MSQFTIYKNEDDTTNSIYPFFIDVQNVLLADLNSRLVIPLSLHQALNSTDVKRLCPIIEIADKKMVLLTHQMTSVPKSILKTEVSNAKKYRYEILGAIDLLLSGI